jgi:hypothetical protein
MKNQRFLALVLALAAAPCFGGVAFTSITSMEGAHGHPGMTQKARGWVSGGNAKIEYVESGNPILPAGSYSISRDGGATQMVVNPKDRTYYPLDLKGAMAGLKGMDIRFDNLKVQKLLDEAGPLVAGVPTRHYRYRTSYRMTMQLMGSHVSEITMDDEIWSAPKLLDAALGMTLSKSALVTGNESFDKLIRAEYDKIQGFPLKKISTNTTSSEGKAPTTTHTTMEVTELHWMPIPDSTFEVPAGYKKTEMFSHVLDAYRPKKGKPVRGQD